jgi:hypothetical protein
MRRDVTTRKRKGEKKVKRKGKNKEKERGGMERGQEG